MGWLSRVFGVDFVAVQSTVDLSETVPDYDEPEPDVFVTREPAATYARRHPAPRDLVLLLEVSDTTLPFDLTTKALHYALAGVPEYWVVDLIGRQIYAHTLPANGKYGVVTLFRAGESISCQACLNDSTPVSDLLPSEPPA